MNRWLAASIATRAVNTSDELMGNLLDTSIRLLVRCPARASASRPWEQHTPTHGRELSRKQRILGARGWAGPYRANARCPNMNGVEGWGMRVRWLRDQAKAQRHGCRRSPAAHVELGEDMHQVSIDRALADRERHGNLLVRSALHDEA